MTSIRTLAAVLGLLLSAACGTTFELPEVSATADSQARTMFAKARSQPPRPLASQRVGEQRFQRVAPRVKPVAERYCRALAEDSVISKGACSARVEIDRKMKERNAYFTYERGRPVVRLSLPLLQDAANDDEVAFVLGHEYGHLIGRHVEKQSQQALVGALVLGTFSAAVGAHPDDIASSVELGAAAGTFAYSQSYELESDTLGARIAAESGYDPVKGALYFARPAETHTRAGNLSFWGTHPPDEKRLATVIEVANEIEAEQPLRPRQQ